MGFLRKNKDLHALHAEADAKAKKVVDIFNRLADDLQSAADQHRKVSDEAQAKMDELAKLHIEARDAAYEKTRKANAIADLVS